MYYFKSQAVNPALKAIGGRRAGGASGAFCMSTCELKIFDQESQKHAWPHTGGGSDSGFFKALHAFSWI